MKEPITCKAPVDTPVIVYDNYRFAIPLTGLVKEFSGCGKRAKVELLQSNNAKYPMGCSVWVHVEQLRLNQ